MSKGIVSFLGFAIAGVVLLATTTEGCGGGSSTNVKDVCAKSCNKAQTCNDLHGQTLQQCTDLCAALAGGSSGSSSNSCGGQSTDQIGAKFDACIAMSCDTYQACEAQICAGNNAGAAGASGAAGAHGTAGASGAAGAHGTAGASGGADVLQQICSSECNKFDSCGQLGGLPAATCTSLCTASATGAAGSGGGPSPDSCNMTPEQIKAKLDQCTAGTCDAFSGCVDAICPGGNGAAGASGAAGARGTAGASGAAGASGTAGASGAAGASGTAGASGAAGASGGGDCAATCGKAHSCCAALYILVGQSGSACNVYTTKCTTEDPATALGECQTVLATGSQAGISACQ
jgi:hypothetical protein